MQCERVRATPPQPPALQERLELITAAQASLWRPVTGMNTLWSQVTAQGGDVVIKRLDGGVELLAVS
ncbi:hypothetical protein EYF80_059340 [Liparis tanakae]|uniref:Uncharacterized protein n=1 Tax=Liparis tanakae TaxID=230148 RepID=A0A4Z2ENX9_9TELE|nr:hypothetical protein EYF80_059340 [Liparis tanakae]